MQSEFPVVLCRTADPSLASENFITFGVVAAPLARDLHIREMRGAVLPIRACLSMRFAVIMYNLGMSFGEVMSGSTVVSSCDADGSNGASQFLTDVLAPEGFPNTVVSSELKSIQATTAILQAAHVSCVRAGCILDPEEALTFENLVTSDAAPPAVYVEFFLPLGEWLSLIVDVRNSARSGIESIRDIPRPIAHVISSLAEGRSQGWTLSKVTISQRFPYSRHPPSPYPP